MHLSGKILEQLDAQKIGVPSAALLNLPERVLQFGTGVLLRGLPDHFIDKANKQGLFNGRIVVVKSTAQGDTTAFAEQDGLYTLIEKGMVDGKPVERISVNASVSRVVSATEEWNEILSCAANPLMQVIISNTTEVGISLREEDAFTNKPISFPGRVLAFLEERYRVFNGAADAGMVIIPTELIVDNGTKLKEIILKLALLKKVSPSFLQWLEEANEFCNSLVDCIVPGKLSAAEQQEAEKKLGYEDKLLIMSEPYRLWAIETKQVRTASILSFSSVDAGVVLARDINKFRELKLRLLNATHTLSCGLAYLAGFTTVKEAMADSCFRSFVASLMQDEIAPLVVSDTITAEEAGKFAQQVIDRFSNPFIEHAWLSITMQYSSKMQMRTVPLIEKYFRSHTKAPERISLGYAAYILFMQADQGKDEQWYGELNGTKYKIQDDKAPLAAAHWQNGSLTTVSKLFLQDENLFGTDLSKHNVFTEAVQRAVIMLKQDGAKHTLHSIFAKI